MCIECPFKMNRIEGLHFIQECSHFKGLVLLYTEISTFQEVGIEEFHCVLGIEWLHFIQRCPHFRGL